MSQYYRLSTWYYSSFFVYREHCFPRQSPGRQKHTLQVSEPSSHRSHFCLALIIFSSSPRDRYRIWSDSLVRYAFWRQNLLRYPSGSGRELARLLFCGSQRREYNFKSRLCRAL